MRPKIILQVGAGGMGFYIAASLAELAHRQFGVLRYIVYEEDDLRGTGGARILCPHAWKIAGIKKVAALSAATPYVVVSSTRMEGITVGYMAHNMKDTLVAKNVQAADILVLDTSDMSPEDRGVIYQACKSEGVSYLRVGYDVVSNEGEHEVIVSISSSLGFASQDNRPGYTMNAEMRHALLASGIASNALVRIWSGELSTPYIWRGRV